MGTVARHSVSVAAVVVDDQGRVLVTQRRDNGHWEPPGGVLELNETVTEGLKREVREETGLNIEPLYLSGVYKNMMRGVVALVFRARLLSGTPILSEETRRVEWWDVESVDARMDKAYSVRVLDALNVDGCVSVRAHDGGGIVKSNEVADESESESR